MNKLNTILIIFCIVFLLSCSSSTNNNSQQGKEVLPLKMTLSPALDQGYDISRVKVTISKDDFTDYLNLTVQDTIAFGEFTRLNIGLYSIFVEVFENENLIALGNGTGEVIAGQTTTVYINLQLVITTGNLEIIVNWEDLEPEIPQRILFIGNSYTYYNQGLDLQVLNIAQSSDPEIVLETYDQTFGGYSLENHYNNQETQELIRNGNWDLVILQEQSTRPIENPDLMYFYASKLDSLIDSTGSETGFFMTWAREYDPDMIEDLAAAYNYCGEMLEADVFPVGRAFEKCLDENPDIILHSGDGSHPSTAGTYLAACVFYAAIWKESPVGIEYINDENISEQDKETLQSVAWEVIEEYF